MWPFELVKEGGAWFVVAAAECWRRRWKESRSQDREELLEGIGWQIETDHFVKQMDKKSIATEKAGVFEGAYER